jgi:hypothetical protein
MAKKATKASAKPTDPRFEVLKMLTPEQKDKLLLKLFRKDPMLVEKLAFEFFEDKNDLEQRRQDIKAKIDRYIIQSYIVWDTPGDLMMEMRSINGRIAEHVKITKDKYGEVELTLLLLNTAFERFWTMLNAKMSRADTFSEYCIKRTLHIIKCLDKLHEDNYLDFKEDLDKLYNYLHTYKKTANEAKSNSIPTKFEF